MTTADANVSMHVDEALAAGLAALGDGVFFGLLGSGNFLISQRLVDRFGWRMYWARHESGVVAMADGWSRTSGKVGVATLHQGPGLANAVTPLIEAVKARTSLVVVVGDSRTDGLNIDNQRIDQSALVHATGAGVERVLRAAAATTALRRAWSRAVLERRPIVVVVPVDVQEETADEGELTPLPLPGPSVPTVSAVDAAADLLLGARRPVILAGRGASDAEDTLLALGDEVGALLGTSALGKGLFAGSPWSVGILGGFASPAAEELVPEADLVLAVGASVNRWTTGDGRIIDDAVPLVVIDDDPASAAARRAADLNLIGDARCTVDLLIERVRARRGASTGWRTAATAARLAGLTWSVEGGTKPDVVDPRRLLLALDERLPPDRVIATDSGRYVGWVAMHLGASRPRSFVFTQAFMSLGLGMPSGLGAAIARPESLAVVVTGDGGLAMSLGEMDALASQGVPILLVVMDDGAYGAEVHIFGDRAPVDLVRFGTRDFAGVARALGGRAATVRSLADLDGELVEWLDRPHGLFVLDAKVDGTVRETWSAHVFRH